MKNTGTPWETSVRCVNAHDELVAALGAILDNQVVFNTAVNRVEDAAIEELRAAITEVYVVAHTALAKASGTQEGK